MRSKWTSCCHIDGKIDISSGHCGKINILWSFKLCSAGLWSAYTKHEVPTSGNRSVEKNTTWAEASELGWSRHPHCVISFEEGCSEVQCSQALLLQVSQIWVFCHAATLFRTSSVMFTAKQFWVQKILVELRTHWSQEGVRHLCSPVLGHMTASWAGNLLESCTCLCDHCHFGKPLPNPKPLLTPDPLNPSHLDPLTLDLPTPHLYSKPCHLTPRHELILWWGAHMCCCLIGCLLNRRPQSWVWASTELGQDSTSCQISITLCQSGGSPTEMCSCLLWIQVLDLEILSFLALIWIWNSMSDQKRKQWSVFFFHILFCNRKGKICSSMRWTISRACCSFMFVVLSDWWWVTGILHNWVKMWPEYWHQGQTIEKSSFKVRAEGMAVWCWGRGGVEVLFRDQKGQIYNGPKW